MRYTHIAKTATEVCMIRLNGIEFEYRPVLSLIELVDKYNQAQARVRLDDCIIIVNGAAFPASQAQELILNDNDSISIVPMLDGG